MKKRDGRESSSLLSAISKKKSYNSLSSSEKEPQQKVVKTIKLVEAEDTYGGNSLTASSPKWSKTWPQHLSAFLAAQGATCAGIVLGWTSPILPYLQISSIERGETPITSEESSWIASLLPLGALVGALVGGYCADVFGRKWTILGSAIPYFVGLALCAVSTSIPYLYAGRYISGLSVGVTTAINPIYVDEIAEDEVRGTLGIYVELMITVGILWSFIVGSYSPYIWFSISSAVIPVIFFGAFMFMPESPIHLLAAGRDTKAEEALKWLRGVKESDSENIKMEINVLKNRLNKGDKPSIDNHIENSDTSENMSTYSLIRKICFIVFGLMTYQQLCGIDAVTFNVVSIFQDAGTAVSSNLSCVIVGIIQLIATTISFLTVDRVGRRVLLLISLTSMSICHALFAINFGLKNYNLDPATYSFIPLFAMSVYFIAFSIGMGPIPWFMVAELSPSESKEKIGSAVVSYSWILAFLVTKYFSSIVVTLGSLTTYATLSGICISGILFVAIFVPETKGKSKEQIEDQLLVFHVMTNLKQ